MTKTGINIRDPHEICSLGAGLTEGDQRFEWRSLFRRTREAAYADLGDWRQEYEADGLPKEQDDLAEAVDKAVQTGASLMALGLTGVASERKWFVDQRSVFDAIVDVPNWDWHGKEPVFSIPWTLGYVFHSLHGAICVKTRQISRAVDLADSPVFCPRSHAYERVWSVSPLIGWSAAFGDSCTNTARYLVDSVARWSWIEEFFDSEMDCRLHVAAYYLLLNIHELSVHLSTTENFARRLEQLAESRSGMRLEIPLDTIHHQQPEVRERAMLALLRCEERLPYVWKRLGVSRQVVEDAWPYWIRTVSSWFGHVYNFELREGVPHAALFELMRA